MECVHICRFTSFLHMYACFKFLLMFVQSLVISSLITFISFSPSMGFYQSAFYGLISGCALMTYKQYYTNIKPLSGEEQPLVKDVIDPRAKAEANKFCRLFLTVYCLVMASDWLQGISERSHLRSHAYQYRTLCVQSVQRSIWHR